MPKKDYTGLALRFGLLETVTIQSGGTMVGSVSSADENSNLFPQGYKPSPYCALMSFSISIPEKQAKQLDKLSKKDK